MDRTVYARGADGRQVVRYDRAGKWFIEWPADQLKAARKVTLRDAVAETVTIASEGGGDVRWGLPGGQMFYAALRKALGMPAKGR